jgi:hypothetical protein
MPPAHPSSGLASAGTPSSAHSATTPSPRVPGLPTGLSPQQQQQHQRHLQQQHQLPSGGLLASSGAGGGSSGSSGSSGVEHGSLEHAVQEDQAAGALIEALKSSAEHDEHDSALHD